VLVPAAPPEDAPATRQIANRHVGPVGGASKSILAEEHRRGAQGAVGCRREKDEHLLARIVEGDRIDDVGELAVVAAGLADHDTLDGVGSPVGDLDGERDVGRNPAGLGIVAVRRSHDGAFQDDRRDLGELLGTGVDG
jgi:hypothetical protein